MKSGLDRVGERGWGICFAPVNGCPYLDECRSKPFDLGKSGEGRKVAKPVRADHYRDDAAQGFFVQQWEGLMGWFRQFVYGSSSLRNSDIPYYRAVAATNDVMARMASSPRTTDAARAIMSDIWAQAHNVPFMTTLYETTQEMNAPLKQKRD